VRVTRTVVRPNSRNGGTMIVFRLSKPTVVRITVVRVYPTCERVGAFTVRARAGENRVRFRGRLRGRALPAGTYHLIFRARGAERDAAAVPIVIARGAVSAKALRKARSASACSESTADFESESAPAAVTGSEASGGGGVLGRIRHHVKAPIESAAGAIAETARGLNERVNEAADEPLGRLFLTLIGVIVLTSSILGTIVLTRIVRTNGF
jgi:hypothetical protein